MDSTALSSWAMNQVADRMTEMSSAWRTTDLQEVVMSEATTWAAM